jgi:hypothetical protein
MRKSLFMVTFLLTSCTLVVSQQTAAQAPANPVTESQTAIAVPTQLPQPHTLMDGTPIKLRLSQTMSSANARVGQEVAFEVVEDIKVDDVVVLPKGATAIGNVTDANPKKSMGRAGKLDIAISYARLVDQEKVALRATQGGKGGGHVGAMTGAIVATSIVFFPAAPLFLFIHGKDITIPQGTEVTAFVEGDMRLDMARFGVTPPPPPSAAAAGAAPASVIVESSPPAADIEVDGVFVGSTPSTVAVTPGAHEISIQKKGFADWTRKLNVTGGEIHLIAELEAAAPPPAAPPAPVAAPAPAPAPAPETATAPQSQ